ncbi:hypothetical protein LCM02_12115 [Lutimonas saemankumensis]|uniref:hypothetical protein n=1 Tax=Lutimonas saemankumensis TaxID=483016 RepID=UPI001CD3B3D4|nr:hypothetical protein [Lutimonas saemankumensis]MCA0933201.1 hypothetical protein [Lutimonas saemankumensis]
MSLPVFCQELVEKKIFSSADEILIELDLIDHIRLENSVKEGEIAVYAEALTQAPNFKIEEKGNTVFIKDARPIQTEEVEGLDKVCSIEPNYTSYRVQIPKDKIVYVSIIEGNFYSDSFYGEINLKVEDGIIKLSNPEDHINIRLNTGSVIIKDIEKGVIDAETKMGILNTDFEGDSLIESKKLFHHTVGTSGQSINIRTIMANIYLYERKG